MTTSHLRTRTVVEHGQGIGAGVIGLGGSNGAEGRPARVKADPGQDGILVRLSVWLADVSVDRAVIGREHNASGSDHRGRHRRSAIPLETTEAPLE